MSQDIDSMAAAGSNAATSLEIEIPTMLYQLFEGLVGRLNRPKNEAITEAITDFLRSLLPSAPEQTFSLG